MTDEKKSGTKEYVVVFDQLDAHTGEFASQGVGMPQLAVTKSYFRGDKVMLDKETADRHLAVGAVIEASDKRAKLVKPNEARTQGVTRDVESTLRLEEEPAAVAGGEGVARAKAGKLGTKAELEKLGVKDLKALAAQHGVEVTRGDTKSKLAGKLARVSTGDGETDDDGLNPGQRTDQSPPPEDQPDDGPEE